ncbi:MAG TPA: nucleotide disphospho-sugar-binding domain-containing protein, partial [Egibacteraceae bacterium]|nr:nucleotide disphospho-sugar-binding domain-containing protein [Egibacteraceae bacterium]
MALPALNRARASQGLSPVAHVLDQGRSAARVLILTSRAFDLQAELPPVVKYVGPRLDDPAWVGSWSPPPGDDPLVLAALSSDYQAQEDLLGRIIAALGQEPVRGVVTTGRGIDPGTYLASPNVQVVRAAPHREILQEASLAVTHAGHGATIKALAAGVPLVCLPMGRDQFDVAARVTHAGAGIRLDAE